MKVKKVFSGRSLAKMAATLAEAVRMAEVVKKKKVRK